MSWYEPCVFIVINFALQFNWFAEIVELIEDGRRELRQTEGWKLASRSARKEVVQLLDLGDAYRRVCHIRMDGHFHEDVSEAVTSPHARLGVLLSGCEGGQSEKYKVYVKITMWKVQINFCHKVTLYSINYIDSILASWPPKFILMHHTVLI